MNVQRPTSNFERPTSGRAVSQSLSFGVRRSSVLVFLALLTLTTGCTPTVPTPAPTRAPQMARQNSASVTARGNATLISTVAAAAEAPFGLRIEIWQLQVPAGTVSRNEQFWKHVDEQCF